MEEQNTRVGKIMTHLQNRLSLKEHLDIDGAVNEIRENIVFAGPNSYILAIAIVIASVGLNVNSIPVIIGAMLISPLMGPIIGLGLSLGTNDFRMLRESLRNLAIMVAISIVASTLYFVLTPLKLDNPTELLARTNPTIFDVLIATFSGLAGIIEICRKKKGTVIAGVAIATALMPPLCTIGFGLATLNLHYALGALYLFFINGVFIAFSTFAGVKYLGFKTVSDINPNTRRKNQRWVFLLIVVMIIPSIITAIKLVKQTNFERNAIALVSQCKKLPNNLIFDYECDFESSPLSVELIVMSEIDSVSKETIYSMAEQHQINRSQVRFKFPVSGIGINDKLVKDILQREEKQLAYKDSLIARLQRENEQLHEREQKFAESLATIMEEWSKQNKKSTR